jgi:hypothetical protein
MFKPVKPTTIPEYLESIPSDRQEIIKFLHQFIQDSAPSLTPHFAYNMLGYGTFPYKNYKKELISWPIIALANQKNYVSIYVCALENGQYLAEKYKNELGHVSVGKSCIRFKRLDQINLPTLKTLIQKAAANPGLTISKL